MPPETKPVISKIEEITCKNCVYSVIITREKFYGEMDGDHDCHLHFNPCVRGDWHCSQGRWFMISKYDDGTAGVGPWEFLSLMRYFAQEKIDATRD